MRKVLLALLLLVVFAVLSSAQQQTASAPPQSPRQALIEMANGQVLKHLTVEVQQLLNQPENKQALLALGMTSSIKSEMGGDVQLFESGPVLLSVNQPAHRKIEVQVINDDMSGDEDTMDLSVHSFHDGQEQEEEWQTFLSHFTVTMVRQQNIWRLSKIGVGVELAIGDPEFLKKTYLASMNGKGGMVGGRIGSSVYTTSNTDEVQHVDMAPSQLAMMIGLAERSYAHNHADIGFTCSLPELSETAGTFGLDSQLSTGNYKGYRITLSGCQGKPAASFQLALEPTTGKGGKAYCTDATGNIRVSDDGRASTCLSTGRVDPAGASEIDSVGVDFHAAEPAARPKD
jgi:hypothetical protein